MRQGRLSPALWLWAARRPPRSPTSGSAGEPIGSGRRAVTWVPQRRAAISYGARQEPFIETVLSAEVVALALRAAEVVRGSRDHAAGADSSTTISGRSRTNRVSHYPVADTRAADADQLIKVRQATREGLLISHTAVPVFLVGSGRHGVAGDPAIRPSVRWRLCHRRRGARPRHPVARNCESGCRRRGCRRHPRWRRYAPRYFERRELASLNLRLSKRLPSPAGATAHGSPGASG
jgi:hypothetical protein